MRRRRGGGAAPAEACGVWLDTAELKRGRARPLALRAPRAAGRKPSLGPLPQPGSGDSNAGHGAGSWQSSSSWQSSILSFFSPQPDDKENTRPAAPREEPLVKILPLPQLEGAREEPPGAGQGLQGPARAAQTALELRVGSQGLSRASPGAGGTNPAPGAAPSRLCCSPQSPGPAQPLRERGQLRAGPCRESQARASPSPSRDRDGPRLPLRVTPSPPEPPELGSEPLFTQDSEGNRVIKHW
ncbi:uncharacterized protein VK521_013831 [Ammospiza maritima maritima]